VDGGNGTPLCCLSPRRSYDEPGLRRVLPRSGATSEASARFREKVEEGMYEAAAFYEGRTNRLGDRFLDDIQAYVDRISERPPMGRRVAEHFRVVLARRFPFSVIHAVEEATTVIVALAHQRRRPGNWRDRYPR